jgi:predicted acetyltransferase
MPSFSVRPYEASDWAGYAAVRSAVYRGGKAIEPGENLVPDDSLAFVVEADGRIVGSAVALDMTATCAGDDLRCAGIASVGVLPEARRYGAGQALMCGMTPLLREAGFDIASLYAYSEAFYRKQGYEVAAGRLEIKAPTKLIPHYDGPLETREIEPDDWRRLVPCYEAFASRYSGMNRRKESQWRRSFRGKPAKIYVAGDPVEAYIVVALTEGFFMGQFVQQFAWSTWEGYRAMLGLIRALAINQDFAEWYEPTDTPFGHRLMQHGVGFAWTKQLMFRVLNVPNALSKLRAQSPTEFTLSVADPDAPENQGPWRAIADSSGVHVERTGSSNLSLGPGALAQAVLGSLSLSQLADQGALLGPTDAIEAAGRLFAPRPTLCLDDF